MKQAKRSLILGLLTFGIALGVGCGGPAKVKKNDYLTQEVVQQTKMVKELQAISDSLLAVRTRAEDQLNYLRTMSSKSDQELADTEKAARKK